MPSDAPQTDSDSEDPVLQNPEPSTDSNPEDDTTSEAESATDVDTPNVSSEAAPPEEVRAAELHAEAESEPTDEEPAEPEAQTPFAAVPEKLRHALARQGFDALTPVQAAVLEATDDCDLRISSQTGSGKTVALGFAMAADLTPGPGEPRPTGPIALVITPTRELAEQVRAELEWLFADLQGVRVECVTGGTHVGSERRRLAKHPRVLVGTPGRLGDHLRSNALDPSCVKHVVLDEADQLLDMGFRDELDAIVDALPAERRTHLVSATFPAAVEHLAGRCQKDAVRVEGTALGVANADIEHIVHTVQGRDRYDALVNILLLARGERVLVFVATRADTAVVSEKLAADGFAALPLSGDLAQPQRRRTVEAFRSGTASVIVATDVAARGLDVPDVSVVVHADLPMDSEVYTHRSGRTGRAGRKGQSILLATPRAEQRARHIFRAARVEAKWLPVPAAAEVERALAARQRKRMHALVDEAAELTEERRALAADLLEGRDAEVVVAALLSALRSESGCKPRDIASPAPRKDRHRGVADREGSGNRASRGRSGAFTRFRINWGFRHGANPRRLLAVICRRGDISSREIGAIDVNAMSTTFEVNEAAAADFERRAGKPDDRHPEHSIERDTGDGGDRGRPQQRSFNQGSGGDRDRGGYGGRPSYGNRGGSDRGGYRGHDGGGERGGYRGRDGGADRGGYRGRDGGSDRGGYRGRDGGGERGGYRGRDGSGDQGGYRGRDGGSDRGGYRGRDSGGDRGGFPSRKPTERSSESSGPGGAERSAADGGTAGRRQYGRR